MSTFFSSDSHFGHRNVIKYCNRPFQDVDEMNEQMIKDWNAVVSPSDTVYHLGDFTMWRHSNIDNVIEVVKQLNGTIKLVYGNHDHERMWEIINLTIPNKVVLLGSRVETKVDGVDITLCHYSHQVWNRSHYGAYHLFGHSHNTLPGIGKSMDVGVDSKYALYGDFGPFSTQQIHDQLKLKLQPTFSRGAD